MKKQRGAVVLVHPKFQTLLKVESALNGKSIFDFTQELGERECLISEYFINEKEKGLMIINSDDAIFKKSILSKKSKLNSLLFNFYRIII